MDLQIKKTDNKEVHGDIRISGSKSESNRLLVLQKLYPEFTIKNLSDSDDTRHLQEALFNEKREINIGHAGTAMRFLTAFFASQNGRDVTLSGSDRMHNRPIKILVEAVRSLGADIQYLEKEGFPPLKITGNKLTEKSVVIDGNVSSQYITALMLVAPSLVNGLKIYLKGEVTSVPYIKMTKSLLDQLGIHCDFNRDVIEIRSIKSIQKQEIIVESDWSSASYYYSVVALSAIGSEITLSSYKKNSLQGDVVLAEIYQDFGVETMFLKDKICLKKISEPKTKNININLKNAPDIAQTIAATCFGLNISCTLTGLHTLKIKETDRLVALHNELTKLGGQVTITDASLQLDKRNEIKSDISIETYNDHRMAMAFAPLGLITPITILDADVVTKSYRNFWSDFQQIGFQIHQL